MESSDWPAESSNIFSFSKEKVGECMSVCVCVCLCVCVCVWKGRLQFKTQTLITLLNIDFWNKSIYSLSHEPKKIRVVIKVIISSISVLLQTKWIGIIYVDNYIKDSSHLYPTWKVVSLFSLWQQGLSALIVWIFLWFQGPEKTEFLAL